MYPTVFFLNLLHIRHTDSRIDRTPESFVYVQVQGRRKNTVGYIDTTFGLFRTVLPVVCRNVLKLDCYDVGNSAQYGLTLSGVR